MAVPCQIGGQRILCRKLKSLEGCVALVTTINKSDESLQSAKMLMNVQTFRDCALYQWSVRYELRHDSRY